MANFLNRFLPKKFRNRNSTIPVVRLSGAIMSDGSPLRPALNLASCADTLKKAFEIKKSPAVAIVVNSPGGSPVQSHLIYQRIRALAKEFDKKVHVFVEDAAASGGYMIACAGDDITADPASIVGSIGVVSSGFGFVGAIDKLGIQRRVHTAGQNKSVLDPFLPEKKADIERLKELQLNIHEMFINLVKEGRGDRLADSDDLFTGLFWTGTKGKELGLVDEIGEMRASLNSRYGEDTDIRLVEAKRGLFGRKSAFGVSNLPDILETAAGTAADSVLTALEERALWSRLGL